MKAILVSIWFLLLSSASLAATYVNTTGSDDKTAISGYDTVAFFTEKKAILGSPEIVFEYLGAKWRFSSEGNLNLFKGNPEKYMPEWGGHCAWGVSENSLSRKKLSDAFEFIGGKLYLFSLGNNSKYGARDDFLYGQWKANWRIPEGEKYWPELKKKLEEGVLVQPDSSNYKRTKFD